MCGVLYGSLEKGIDYTAFCFWWWVLGLLLFRFVLLRSILQLLWVVLLARVQVVVGDCKAPPRYNVDACGVCVSWGYFCCCVPVVSSFGLGKFLELFYCHLDGFGLVVFAVCL